ncbi:DUF1837 domain-containing protein [Bartonella sp. HY406]|uniref:HamA C-terminal domain-containing protein n=1 Tax=Bartonella sp. HY406 TaxID=2979331 RepID=UPI0021C56A36|nr:DUF1837 domain-containing protein [Bartonella sp. HY406]UXN05122.1 DUF1837 domain-containing protein [Bartonella sp. HY406]
MTAITSKELDAILSGDPDELDVHLRLIERDLLINNKAVRVHCHCLMVDGNGKVKLRRLAEFMRNAAADYAIPRRRIESAKKRDKNFNSTSAIAKIHEEAINLFTDLSKTGEGGEMLLFLLAERFLKMPHVLCKMDLKTDSRMHYHGADGVYASVSDDGKLKLFWGESKVFANPTDAIRECLKSLAPFLIEEDSEESSRERDLLLLSDKADLGDEILSNAFKNFFDTSLPLSNRVEYCGLAMIGFDVDFYPNDTGNSTIEDIVFSAQQELASWVGSIGARLDAEKLERFDIHFLCVPLPSVSEFRKNFLAVMGRSDD